MFPVPFFVIVIHLFQFGFTKIVHETKIIIWLINAKGKKMQQRLRGVTIQNTKAKMMK